MGVSSWRMAEGEGCSYGRWGDIPWECVSAWSRRLMGGGSWVMYEDLVGQDWEAGGCWAMLRTRSGAVMLKGQ